MSSSVRLSFLRHTERSRTNDTLQAQLTSYLHTAPNSPTKKTSQTTKATQTSLRRRWHSLVRRPTWSSHARAQRHKQTSPHTRGRARVATTARARVGQLLRVRVPTASAAMGVEVIAETRRNGTGARMSARLSQRLIPLLHRVASARVPRASNRDTRKAWARNRATASS